MRKVLHFALPILALWILFTTAGFAQQQTGELLVKVTDPSGAVVSGAKVVVTSDATIAPIQGKTDSNGVAALRGLKPGVYKISVSQTGFRSAVRDKVLVEVGRTYPIDVPLSVGSATETVEVSASDVQIDTVRSENSEIINANKISQIGGTRDFTGFVNILPSVNTENMAAGISVDGASGAENVFYVDGVDTSNMYGGTNNQGVRSEIVQELQIKTGGYEAEFGGAMGGVVSVVTKSGGNDFHGQVYYYYSGSSLEGGRRPTLRLDPNDQTKAQYITYPKDNRNYNELGVSLGGPIWRNKAWFFVNVDPSWQNYSRATALSDGTNGTWTQKQLRRNGLAKIDFQPWDRLRFYASYTQDTYRQTGTLPSYNAGSNSTTFDYSQDGYRAPSYTFNGGFLATITNKILLDTRYGFNGVNNKPFLDPPGVEYYFPYSNAAIGYAPSDPGFVTQYYLQYPTGVGYKTAEDFQKKLNYTSTGSITFNLGGQHNFKTGVEWRRWVWDDVSAYPFDYVRFVWGQTYTGTDGNVYSSSCVGPDGVTYNPCGYAEIRSPFGTVAKIHTDHKAFFFQDAWTIGGRLTVNPGVRFEAEEIPSFSDLPQYKGAAFKWGFGDKVAPRLGAAFDVLGNGKWKVYGSWGWFYDTMKLAHAEGSFGGFKWHSQYYLINQAVADNPWGVGGAHDPAGFSAGCTGGNGGAVDCSGATNVMGMQFIDDRDWRIPSFDSIDPNLHAMRMHNMTFGTEYELMPGYIFSASWVRKRIDYAIEDVGVQTPLGEAYYSANPGYGWSVSKFVEAGMPPTPKAKRDYDALIFRLRKPFSHNWTADLSYTYSRLRGNYGGLASSDEEGNGSSTTRDDPNVERYFDLWFLNYAANGHLIDGPLNTDRPHQIKLNGQYQLPHNLPAIGGFFKAVSGTPITSQMIVNNAEMYVMGRGDAGRMPFFTQTDLYMVQRFKPFKDESKAIEFNVNVTNLFNQRTVTHRFRYLNSVTVDLPSGCADGSNLGCVNNFLQNGWDWQGALNAKAASATNPLLVKDPRYLMSDNYQDPIGVRIGIRFQF